MSQDQDKVGRFFHQGSALDALIMRLDKLLEHLERGYGNGGRGAAPGIPLATPAATIVRTEVGAVHIPVILPFQRSITVATQDDQVRDVNVNGVIDQVIMAFPAGCQQLVEVRVLYLPRGGSSIPIVPSLEDAFIALDDFTAVFSPRLPITPGRIKVEWNNYDSRNAHSVPVIVTVTATEVRRG